MNHCLLFKVRLPERKTIEESVSCDGKVLDAGKSRDRNNGEVWKVVSVLIAFHEIM